MRKTILGFIICTVAVGGLFSAANPWGDLKKIYIYDSLNDLGRVSEMLDQIQLGLLKRKEKKEVARQFIDLGDHYYHQKKYRLAEKFYRKVLPISPSYWYVYNKLERINRDRGQLLFNFKNVFQQFSTLLRDFTAAFFLLNNLLNVLFFSCLLVLFVQAVLLFIKYFRLAGNDLLKDANNIFSLKRVLILAVLLFWPVLLFAGWMIYPFLIFGFLWVYMGSDERRSTVVIMVAVAVVSVLYSFNHMLEKNFRTQDFKIVKQVFDGRLFNRTVYESFDNELKVLQALSYYENDSLKTAEDILNATGENYKSTLKCDILGNINYRFDNIPESIRYYRQSLSLNDKNPIALNNFTMALIKNDNTEIFESWAKRYPEISEHKKRKLVLRDVEIPQRFLWRRLLSLPASSLNFWELVKGVLASLFAMPVLYGILLFLTYIILVLKVFDNVGQSTFCSKCSKIIKETTVHKSYKLCNDCYQLFLIKDVIFLEAKILKEKELAKRTRKRSLILWILSVVVPGLKLSFMDKNRSFILVTGLFFFTLGYYVFGSITLRMGFGTSPIFLNFIGLLAVLIYLVSNIMSLWGEEDGL